MQDVTSIGSRLAGLGMAPPRPAAPPPRPHPPGAMPQDADRVELSESAMSDELSEERIREIREQIAADSYLTPEKLDVVVERLLEAMQRGAEFNPPPPPSAA